MSGNIEPRPRLVVVAPPPLRGRSADVTDEVVVLGRDPRSTLVLEDPHVSRRHAVLRRTAGGYVLEDTHSTSGTRLNQQPLGAPTEVRDGDVISIAGVTLRYEDGSGRPLA